MRSLILVCGLWAQGYCLSTVHADELGLYQRLGESIQQHAVMRANFTQTKRMAALKRPLVTHGNLLYTKEHGVIWQIIQPYNMSYILSDESMIEISADGNRKERMINDTPGFAQISRIFRAMLGADTNELNVYFNTEMQSESSDSNKQWKVLLTPKKTQTSRFIKEITIEGNQFVESIQINESSTDSTVILFSNTEVSQTLHAAELALFGQN